MENLTIKNSGSLKHHGIDGQKWGIRRYQNSDGSLTAAGRERYGVGPARGSNNASTKSADRANTKAERDKERARKEKERAEKIKARNDAKLAREKLKLERKKQELEIYRTKKESRNADKEIMSDIKEISKDKIAASDDPRLILKYKSLFTTDELKNIYTRIETERNIQAYIPKVKTTKDKALAFLKDSAEATKNASAVITSVMGIISSFKKLTDNSESNNTKGLKEAKESITKLEESVKKQSEESGKTDDELFASISDLKGMINDIQNGVDRRMAEADDYVDVTWREIKHSFANVKVSDFTKNVI